MASKIPNQPGNERPWHGGPSLSEWMKSQNEIAERRTKRYIWTVNTILSGLQAIRQTYEVQEHAHPQTTIITLVNPVDGEKTHIVIAR